ncbi:hypothetical protein VRU48_12395 [Pedobacter sp. KR3-3]|uniref:Toxin-antitoxin system YwqK family antitoxin n=1 Tax=Pedobacter albus TaxID=3113905 RepID=A0ABU7I8W7_9SPHI|nr:hypothetical protein [Pedobacter sp. KR3-3]MEE1945912.1 hypothetical protein [Pedobacter sp. KR3-3]
MQRYLLLLLFLGLGTQLKAQRYKDLYDPSAYRHTINYDDHKVVFQAQPDNKELSFTETDKKYYWFSHNQIKATQGGFSGKLLHGLYSDFYLNSNLKEQGYFRLGLKIGEWKSWTEEGVLVERTNYSNGELNGRFYKYDKQGRLSEEGTYKRGKINGRFRRYVSADSVNIAHYKNGVLQPTTPKSGWFSRLFKKKENTQKKAVAPVMKK